MAEQSEDRATAGAAEARSVRHTVGILVFEGVKLLDVAGPAEVFAEANLFGADYRISLLSPTGNDVHASIGMRVPVEGAARDKGHLDTLLITGGEPSPATRVPDDLVAAALHLAGRSGRVASICTGAFVLGAAGLLDGKESTTHWKHTGELARRHPATRVQPDRVYVKDHTTYSSAGATAGIDLALALLEEDHGVGLAREVARSLVMYMQLADRQSHFPASLDTPGPRTPVVRLVSDTVKSDPTADYSLSSMAEIARVSPRHLTRLFREELNTTPTRYVELVRFDLAKAHLDAGQNVTAAAQLSGFGSPESLRRAFIRRLNISPLRYQRRFSSGSGVATH